MQPIQVHLEIKREIGGLSTLNVSLGDLLVADNPPCSRFGATIAGRRARPLDAMRMIFLAILFCTIAERAIAQTIAKIDEQKRPGVGLPDLEVMLI